MDEALKPEIRQVTRGTRGKKLHFTGMIKEEAKIHVISDDTSPYLSNGEWCRAELYREVATCVIYDCFSLADRLTLFVGVDPSVRRMTSMTWKGEKLIGRGDLTSRLLPYLELSTDYRWPVVVGVHLVYAGAEHLVRDIIAAHPLP